MHQPSKLPTPGSSPGVPVCTDCGVVLTDKNAYKRGGGRKGYQGRCKVCWNDNCWQRSVERKERAVAHMGGKCQVCGYDKCIAALEFHHIDPTEKEMEWNKMRVIGEQKLFKELDKCVMLCANCHRELHHDS